MEGGCRTAYTDNHYNSDFFSVIYRHRGASSASCP